jgi:8-oxo-dGTP diphosphatase
MDPPDPPAPFHPTATRRVRQSVRVGVGVVVATESGAIYAGYRKGSHGAGTLALPGGHLEVYESWEECARRAVMEEMNVELHSVEFLHVTNDPMPDEDKHYVTIFMMARLKDPITEPENMEPDKCEGWNGYDWDTFKSLLATGDLFGPLARLVREDPPALRQFLQREGFDPTEKTATIEKTPTIEKPIRGMDP